MEFAFPSVQYHTLTNPIIAKISVIMDFTI